ncbi:ABC transporter permease [Pseudomethylobacillus aquaticus]|uniref:ABC transporter permease n=1 Tax=Pseudomethylobacillus aquaticus TaxID=2676064 RepID=UPI00138FE30C|nr:ABC transporter permease [Pseudomethylobacillus aquaticus]
MGTLKLLWHARAACSLPLPRAYFWQVYAQAHRHALPYVLLGAAIFAVVLFHSLASVLGSAHLTALTTLWQSWVLHIAPLMVALVVLLHAAPLLASDLHQRQRDGGFEGLRLAGYGPAAFPAIPSLYAHAAVAFAMAALGSVTVLLTAMLVTTLQDQTPYSGLLDAVLLALNPWAYLLCSIKAWVLVMGGMLPVCLYAWPGRLRHSERESVQYLATGAIRWAMLGSMLAWAGLALLLHAIGI